MLGICANTLKTPRLCGLKALVPIRPMSAYGIEVSGTGQCERRLVPLCYNDIEKYSGTGDNERQTGKQNENRHRRFLDLA